MPKIYLIESVNNFQTIYKIGYTKNKTLDRIKQLQTGTESDLKLICEFETEFGMKLESILHRHFSYKKIKNEWFSLDLDEVADFKKICEKIENNLKLISKTDNYYFNKQKIN